MSKRHNRKRTRSRPRHRDGSKALSNHSRSFSVDTNCSFSTTSAPLPPSYLNFPLANAPPDHWHQTYSAWQTRLRLEQEREHILEAQRLRFFGGEVGDETSLLEPMLRVVTDLFDGMTDYDDP